MRRAVLPILILLVGFAATWFMPSKRPASEDGPPTTVTPTVSIIEAKPEDLALSVMAYGSVTPRTEIDLVAEVSGKLTYVAPSFVAGGFVSRGELLLSIDRRDFELAVTRAEAVVAEARQNLERERAEADLAREDWQALANGRKASPLVLREPQMEDARAKLKAAKADLALAELALDRTGLRAPFDGRVRSRDVDVGSYVAPGEALARLYATDVAEVRLPLDDRQLRYLQLPLGGRFDHQPSRRPKVEITAEFAGRRHQWSGQIVRTEGAIDPESRQLYAVAEIADPYATDRENGKPLLAPGMFVTAVIEGAVFERVYSLPAETLRDPGEVLVVDDQDVLQARSVEILKSEPGRVVVNKGLSPGDRLVLSRSADLFAGTTVRIEPSEEPSSLARAER